MAVFLIKEGASVNAKTQMHETPLHYAAQLGHADVMAILLVRRVRVSKRSVLGGCCESSKSVCERVPDE